MNAPKLLKESPHWLLRKGKDPIGLSGSATGWDNPNAWMSYDDAMTTYEQTSDQLTVSAIY